MELKKTKVYPQHPIAIDNNQKVKHVFALKINMLIIYYMPPSDAMKLYWGLCN